MAIEMTCPHCERPYTLADTAAGKTLRCKECKEVFTVEAQEPPQAPEKRPRRRAPRPKARRGIPLWVWLLLGGGGLAFLAVAGVVVVLLMLPGSRFSLVNRVTFQNYEKLKIGMNETQLQEILGPPTERIDDYADYIEQTGALLPGMKLSPLERQLFAGTRILTWRRGDDYIRALLQGDEAIHFKGHFANVGTFSHGLGNPKLLD